MLGCSLEQVVHGTFRFQKKLQRGTIKSMKRKRVLMILLNLLFIVITVCSCGKNNEVLSVELMIESLITVSVGDETLILEAEEAYSSLSERDREQVENYSILLAARANFNAWKEEKEESDRKYAADKEKADAVVFLINQIGDVTLDSDNAINEARNAFDELSATQKEMVTNFSKLTASEEILELQIEQVVNVITLIESIGQITPDSRRSIENAISAYNNLDDDLKVHVSNLNLLITAIDVFAPLIISYVEELIDEIGAVSLLSGESIRAATYTYNTLYLDEKEQVSNASVLFESQELYDNLVAEENLRVATEEARSIVRVRRLWHSRPNFVGGVNIYINFTNNSEKTIKYLNFVVQFHNNVGDSVSCDIRGSSFMSYRATGPFDTGRGINGTSREWESFYNHTVSSVELSSLNIEYMDGTRIHLSREQLQLVQG
jgi:hypothetical protein